MPAFSVKAQPNKTELGFLRTHSQHRIDEKMASSVQKLSSEVERRTSIDLDANFHIVDLGSGKLVKYPILVSVYEDEFLFDESRNLKNLSVHLKRGAIWLIDFRGDPGAASMKKLERLLSKIYPAHKLEEIRKKHVLFSSFYLLDRAYGLNLEPFYWRAVEYGGRFNVLVSLNGAFAALARDPFGNYVYPVSSGLPHQREMVIRTLINFVMYCLCLDYKNDQVHVPFILKRRR